MFFRARSFLAAALVLNACTEEDLTAPDGGTVVADANATADAGRLDAESAEAGLPDSTAPLLCSDHAIGATLVSSEGEPSASIPLYTIHPEKRSTGSARAACG
jgi:hypothetical protein